jgi:peptide deformylase
MTSTFRYPPALELVHYPAPVLRKVAAPVTEFNADLAGFCDAMFACMDTHRGVGLAAPQVGVSRRIFVTDHAKREGDALSDRRIWINPRLENLQGSEVYEEGCLSFPGIYAKVERANSFDIVFQDVTGFEHRLTLDVMAGDFLGVVTQHELDHLDGKVFIDYLNAAQLGLVRRRLRELEKDYKEATGKAGSLLRK